MKSNIIFFTGPNTVFLRRDLQAWKSSFTSRHDQMNLLELSSLNRDDKMVIQECMTPGFFWGSRLIVLSDLPYSSDTPKKDISPELEDSLIQMIEEVPDTNFILFVQPYPDKRKKLYKALMKQATIKEYPEPSPAELWVYISEQLPQASSQVKRYVSQISSQNIERGQRVMEQISAYHPEGAIAIDVLKKNIVPEDIEGKIFDFLDGVLARDLLSVHRELPLLLDQGSPFMLLGGILSNLRKILYGLVCMQSGNSADTVAFSLGIHPFVLKKNSRYISQAFQIQDFYNQLIDLDYKVKTGGISHSSGSEEALKMHLSHLFLNYR